MTRIGNIFLVKGGTEMAETVLAYLRSHGVAVRDNPDLYIHEYRHFGVEEARALRAGASMKAVGSKRVFLITASQMTVEAQNALLKTIEEPRGDALFVFIVPSPESLLATVRSRAQMLELRGEAEVSEVDCKKFVAAAPSLRIDMLKPLLEKDTEDVRDIGKILAFLSALEREIDSRGMHHSASLEPVYRARRYVTDKGALVKPLLEQVALLTPRL